jgi:hypothetical protein
MVSFTPLLLYPQGNSSLCNRLGGLQSRSERKGGLRNLLTLLGIKPQLFGSQTCRLVALQAKPYRKPCLQRDKIWPRSYFTAAVCTLAVDLTQPLFNGLQMSFLQKLVIGRSLPTVLGARIYLPLLTLFNFAPTEPRR